MVSQLTNDVSKPKQCNKGTPNNYCWTHGFIISANHMSKTSKNKAQGNKIDATMDNIMEGNLVNKPTPK